MTRRLPLSILALLFVARSATAQIFPAGFARTDLVTSGLSGATCCCIAPDGTAYICLQGGTMRVWRAGTGLLPDQFFLNTPLTVDSAGERGLIGLELDPDFASNRYLYVYYTATTPAAHNRISRFTADAGGALAVAGSETVLLDLNDLSSATNHNGGGLHFGPDGMLYASVGENANGNNAQLITNLLGKILRINTTPGSIIPADNPPSFPGISGSTTGNNQAIWAVGLRNPFTFAFQPNTGRMFINDVGAGSWEEINDGIAGRNYGWPDTEGDFNPSIHPNFTRPFFTYPHSSGTITGGAIVGGTFYNPPISPFPASYYGHYFFADYISAWIKEVDIPTVAVTAFGGALGNVVDVDVDGQGRLVYLTHGGRFVRVDYTSPLAPAFTSQPVDQSACVGDTVLFSVTVAGSSPLTFAWRRNGVILSDGGGISGASTRVLTITNAQPGAAGQYDCVVQNANGSQTSDPSVLSVGGGVVYDGALIESFVVALFAHSTATNDLCAFDFNRNSSVDAGDVGGMVTGLLGM